MVNGFLAEAGCGASSSYCDQLQFVASYCTLLRLIASRQVVNGFIAEVGSRCSSRLLELVAEVCVCVCV